MRTSRVLSLGALLLGALLAAGGSASSLLADDVPLFRPMDGSETQVVVTSEPSHYEQPTDDGRTHLAAVAACSETRLGTIEVTLGWEAEGAGSDTWRVDVSAFGTGFATGRYLTSDALPGSRREIDFAGAEPGLFYYWRLLGREGEDWVLRANGRFEAPICPVDRVGGES